MSETIRQAMHLIGPEKRLRWVLLVVIAVFASGVEVLGAALVYTMISLVSDPGGEIDLPLVGNVRGWLDQPQDTILLGMLVAMAVFFVLRAAVQIGSTYAQKRIANNAGARLSNRLVAGYLAWPYAAHLRRNSSELIRNGHQAAQAVVDQVFVPLIRITAESVLTIGLIILLIGVAPLAAALALVVIGTSALLLLLFVQPRLKRLGRIAHETQRDTLAVLQQSLHGLRDIKILGRERYFARAYGRSRMKLARMKYLRSTMTELPRSIMELALIGFILLFFGATLVLDGANEGALAVLGLFAYVGLRLQPSLQRIISGFNEIKFSAAPLEDLHRDLLAVKEAENPEPANDPLPFEDLLEFDGVDFFYEGTDRPALRNVALRIRPGEQVGICGPTGGGKTTLVDLLTGLLQPTSGTVRVDGQDLRKNARAWQRNLGVVPQMVFLTDDTLRRNIALGVPDDEIDVDAVNEAVELAQLTDFVSALPDGLDTAVGERGVRISGGQRQRIAIARALYRRPPVLVFDEGTSALDNATEAMLMEAIERLRGRHTIILIAHRLSTVRSSDRVVFIEAGEVAGQGTFDELTSTNERFRAMASSG